MRINLMANAIIRAVIPYQRYEETMMKQFWFDVLKSLVIEVIKSIWEWLIS